MDIIIFSSRFLLAKPSSNMAVCTLSPCHVIRLQPFDPYHETKQTPGPNKLTKVNTPKTFLALILGDSGVD